MTPLDAHEQHRAAQWAAEDRADAFVLRFVVFCLAVSAGILAALLAA